MENKIPKLLPPAYDNSLRAREPAKDEAVNIRGSLKLEASISPGG